MNDNRPSRSAVQADMLTMTDVAQHHLGSSLRTFLQESGVSPAVQDAVQEFVRPVVERLRATESLVLAFVQEPGISPASQIDAFSGVISRLEEFGREFVRDATPDQETRASAFQRFVEGVSAAWEPPVLEPEVIPIEPPDVIEDWGVRLEGFANEFERSARDPLQKMLAASFREFTQELMGDRSREATQGKEPGKDMDLER